MVSITPSFPAPDFASLTYTLNVLIGTASAFQIDIVDGDFATPASWPFIAKTEDLLLLQPYAEQFDFEFDCMVREPQQYFDQLAAVGTKRIIIHWGSTSDLAATVNAARAQGWQVGLAITNDTPLTEVLAVLEQFDYVQVMGIARVGTQGQPFDERTLETVAALRAHDSVLEIAVDGSVNADTIPALVTAGATRLAPGSAITKADDLVSAYQHLTTLANQ